LNTKPSGPPNLSITIARMRQILRIEFATDELWLRY
jgi:hypothetical protein